MPFAVFNEQAVLNTPVAMVAANGTTTLSVLAGQSKTATRVNAITVVNTDSIAHVVRVYFAVGGVFYLLGSMSVAAGQGTGGTAPDDILAFILGNTNGLVLAGAEGIGISQEVAITGANTVTIVIWGATV